MLGDKGRGTHRVCLFDMGHLSAQPSLYLGSIQVDTAVKLVLVGGESHEVPSFFRNQLFMPTASIPLGYAEGEASYIINHVEATR